MLKRLYYNLPIVLQNYIDKAASKISNSFEEEFINSDIGNKYNLDSRDKQKIINRIKLALKKIDSATSINVHLELGKQILSLDKKDGYIVECGSFKGATTISLSIFSKIVGKKLIIYDSFEGLPKDIDQIQQRNYPYLKLTGKYKEGMYEGNLEEVKQNVNHFGEIDLCDFRKGFFENTMKSHKEIINFLFLDVDLVSSTKDCMKHLWKYIEDDAYIYSDDACDIDVVKFWYDNQWWKENHLCEAPGYIGSGCGIPLGGKFSSLGFTVKNQSKKNYNKAYFLY